MASNSESDEVAEDYKNSLEDLNINSRWEIGNLTVIAKENMDHALAISKVLENHIKTTPPNRKLTALYVLDSIVKNVGTPYTLFFGRNLYSIYMHAYTLVDGAVRRKLEEMLKTWKEPVPGSMDARPVFPAEITRSIENALIKARTAALGAQQQQTRPPPGRGSATAWRNTPTPPGFRPGSRPGELRPQQNFSQQDYANLGRVPSPMRAQASDPSQLYNANLNGSQQHEYHQSRPSIPTFVSVDLLNTDLSNLIGRARVGFTQNPLDPDIQQRLKALLDLQGILQSQALPQEQLRQIYEQVSQLNQSAPMSQQPAPQMHAQPPHPTPSVPNQQHQSIENLLPPNTLAALLGSMNSPQHGTPQENTSSFQPPPVPSQLAHPVSQTPPPTTQSQAQEGSSLISALRAAGILPAGANATPTPQNQPLPIPRPNSAIPPPQRPMSFDISLNSKSLQLPRPHLISSLYEARPNQCKTCGQRFMFTEKDKQKKERHLDWHFQVNMRLADASKRGQSRSWYVDEMDWIKSRENDDEGDSNDLSGRRNQTADQKEINGLSGPKKKWIPVPDDPAMANSNCPICQEKFETVWHDDAQEWVWMDAVRIGNRVYHASCHTEATRDGVKSPPRGVTPDLPLLGKRKAVDDDLSTLRAKLKRESEVQ